MSKESFLRKYSKLSEKTEIPGIFAVWCGLACLSCVLGRRVWIDMGVYTVFPNLFVTLVASSGRCRKSVSIDITNNLLCQVQPKPNLISQKITPEGLIAALTETQINNEKELLKQSCTGFVIADELSTFLNRQTYEQGLASLLIPLFDCKTEFSYRTRSRGMEVLSESCLGLLGASTIDWIKAAIPEEAIGGGLTSRMIFVYCPDIPKPVAITRHEPEHDRLKAELIRFLEGLLEVKGEMKLSQEAWNLYEKIYYEFYKKTSMYDLPTLAGYASRRHVHLLKLSILFSFSRGGDKFIEVEDIQSAHDMLEISEQFMPMLMNIITSTEQGKRIEEVLSYIRAAGKITRRDLLKLVVNKIDTEMLTKICETLVQAGRVQVMSDGGVIYLKIVS